MQNYIAKCDGREELTVEFNLCQVLVGGRVLAGPRCVFVPSPQFLSEPRALSLSPSFSLVLHPSPPVLSLLHLPHFVRQLLHVCCTPPCASHATNPPYRCGEGVSMRRGP